MQQVYYSAGKELAVLLLPWYGKTWGDILCFNMKHKHFLDQACPYYQCLRVSVCVVFVTG
jgi:hypothetical protein